MMTLTSRTAKDPYARMFWDRARNSWTMFAHNMPALKPGRTYQLWIVTAKATMSAGTFDAVNGVGVMRATFAVTPENLRAIAVTEEPAGGVAQPTGETIVSAHEHALIYSSLSASTGSIAARVGRRGTPRVTITNGKQHDHDADDHAGSNARTP